MTAIVGVRHGGHVYLAGDSAASGDGEIDVRRNRKVWKRGEFVLGFAGSLRAGELLREHLRPHPISGPFPSGYLSIVLLPAARDLLRLNEVDPDEVDLLVGARGRLFKCEGLDHVAEPLDDYDAIGSGSRVALGALFAASDLAPERRLRLALKASARHDATVRGPFRLVRTP